VTPLKRLRALLLALLVAAGISAATVQPAMASPYISICNSNYSVANIKAYNDSVRKEYIIDQGQCLNVDNYGGNARVDVEASGQPDVSSWFKWETGGVTDACHNSEASNSNPYNNAQTWYKNYSTFNCAH
jgi:hypothetical protein